MFAEYCSLSMVAVCFCVGVSGELRYLMCFLCVCLLVLICLGGLCVGYWLIWVTWVDIGVLLGCMGFIMGFVK